MEKSEEGEMEETEIITLKTLKPPVSSLNSSLFTLRCRTDLPNRFRHCRCHSRYLGQLFNCGRAHALQAAEVAQQRLAPSRTDAEHGVQRRTEPLLGTELAMIGDCEPVRLITHPLEEE